MYKLIVFIDDEIHQNTPYGKKLENLIEECEKKIEEFRVQAKESQLQLEKCHLELRFINTKKGVQEFINSSQSVNLVLLDRDLTKIDMEPVDILKNLYGKGVPVIILSRYKATDKRFKEDFRKLDKRLDYLLKSDIETPGRRAFVKNLISRAVTDDGNRDFEAVVCNTGKIKILWGKTRTEITDDITLSYANKDWATRKEVPVYPQEIILRILYEMGDIRSTEANLVNIYTPATEGIVDKIYYELLRRSLEGIMNKSYILTAKGGEYINQEIGAMLENINNNKKIGLSMAQRVIEKLRGLNIPAVDESIEALDEIGGRKIYLPQKFNDALSSFNETVREKTKGLIVGSLLQGTRGKGKHLYKANIGRIELEDVKEYHALSWKADIEKRLERIESILKKHLGANE